MDLKALAVQVLGGKPSVKPEVKNTENRGKLLPSKNTQKFTPISREWITENTNTLHAAGFTEKDLYNNNLPVGIALLNLWKLKGLMIKVDGSTLLFTWTNDTGKRITQSCRPENRQRQMR